MASPILQSLFNSPVKDYILIAKCGKKIEAHRCVLCVESEFFKNLFLAKDMKIENEMQTDIEYNDLMLIVKWMYGFPYSPKESEPLSYDGVTDIAVYNAADKFLVNKLLDWKLYITINDKYLLRFHLITSEKQCASLMEQRNIGSIREEVMRYIITRDTIVTDGIVNSKGYESNDALLYNLSIDLLVNWFHNRHRRNSEEDMILFLKKYQQRHPKLSNEIKKQLAPGIKLSALDRRVLTQFCIDYAIQVPVSNEIHKLHPPTYYYILNKYTIESGIVRKSLYMITKTTHVTDPITKTHLPLSLILNDDEMDLVIKSMRYTPQPLEYLIN